MLRTLYVMRLLVLCAMLGAVNSVDPGCSSDHPLRAAQPGKPDEFVCYGTPEEKFSGHCADGSRELRMFEGNGDNDGTDNLLQCARACLSQKTPIDGRQWTSSFVLRGIVMKPDGRCYCQHADSETCNKVSSEYVRYDLTNEFCHCTCAGCTISPTVTAVEIDERDQLSSRGVTLGLCEGECDRDQDCKGHLRCAVREPATPNIPGCDTNASPGTTWDYCYIPWCSQENAPSACKPPIPVDFVVTSEHDNAPLGTEHRVVPYRGTSCYYSTGTAFTVGNVISCSAGKLCAFDVQELSRNNPELRPSIHNLIVKGTIVKGAAGSTAQDGNTVCKITGDSAYKNTASRALLLNEANQYLTGTNTDITFVRDTSHNQQAELGIAGAIGPGVWTASNIHSTELFDMSMSGGGKVADVFVNGCFDLTIVTVQKAAESRLVLQGTDDDADVTINFDRYNVQSADTKLVSSAARRRRRHELRYLRDSQPSTSVKEVCVFRGYLDENYEGDEFNFGPGRWYSSLNSKTYNTGQFGRDWNERFDSAILEGKHCHAQLVHETASGHCRDKNHWQRSTHNLRRRRRNERCRSGGDHNSYMYRNLYTTGDETSVQLPKFQEDNFDSDGRSMYDFNDDVVSVVVWYRGFDQCYGVWKNMGYGSSSDRCDGYMRFGVPDGTGGFSNGEGWTYRNVKGGNCKESGYDSFNQYYGNPVPGSTALKCQCCEMNINLNGVTRRGIEIPKHITNTIGQHKFPVCKSNSGGFAIAYLGGVGIPGPRPNNAFDPIRVQMDESLATTTRVGFDAWMGSLLGPNMKSIMAITPVDIDAPIATSSAAQDTVFVQDDIHVRWNCSPGKHFVCNDVYENPTTGKSCCQTCQPGRYRVPDSNPVICRSCEAGKFNPIGHFIRENTYSVFFDQTQADVRFKYDESTLETPSCNNEFCKCQNLVENVACYQKHKLPGRDDVIVHSYSTTFDPTQSASEIADTHRVNTQTCIDYCKDEPACLMVELRMFDAVSAGGTVRTYHCELVDVTKCTLTPYTEDMHLVVHTATNHQSLVHRTIVPTTRQFLSQRVIDVSQPFFEVGMECASNNIGVAYDVQSLIGCETECLESESQSGNTCYVATYDHDSHACTFYGADCMEKPRKSTRMTKTTFTVRHGIEITHVGNTIQAQFENSVTAPGEKIELNLQCALHNPMQSSCFDCPAGRYNNVPGSPVCKYCASDTYQPDQGQRQCLACNPGSFSYRSLDRFGIPVNQKMYCETPIAVCDSTTSVRVNNVCVDKRICPPGQVHSVAAGACVECPHGFFAAADSTCARIAQVCLCDPETCATTQEKRGFAFRGKFNTDTLQCEPDCESLGAYYDYELQACQCEGGLALSAGQVKCTSCPRGTYTFESRCVVCDAGQFQDTPGQKSCNVCPNGKYTDTIGSVRCKRCDSNQESTTHANGCQICDNTNFRFNRKYRACAECEPCAESCPLHTFASHNDQTQLAMCTDKCTGGQYDSVNAFECTACPTGKYRHDIAPLPPSFAHNTSYACHYCPTGKFQKVAGKKTCNDGIPFSETTGIDEPTTIPGLIEVVHACATTPEEADCELCGINRTQQTTTISNGVWVAYEGGKLMSQQNYYRFGNLNDGYSQWKYIGNSTRDTQPECSYETFAEFDVPAITSEPHCQMLPNTDYLDDTQTCGDVGQNQAAAINLYSTQACRRCKWPFVPDDACGCVAPQEPYYFPGFKHDTTSNVVSGIGPFLHGGGPTQCPDYSNFANEAFLLVDGVSLINLPAVTVPLTNCPATANDVVCVNGVILCEPECRCSCNPRFVGDTCDRCQDTNADISTGCETCKPGWVTGFYGQCTRCEAGLDVRTGCTECIPFLDDTMCYGVSNRCSPQVQRPEISFMNTRETWMTESNAFVSMPHAKPGRVPAYLDNKCLVHGGMVYTFARSSRSVTVQPGTGNAEVPLKAVQTWPWSLNVMYNANATTCDDVAATEYLAAQDYAVSTVPSELLWSCLQDGQGRQWTTDGYVKMQTSGCSSPYTFADDVLRVLPTVDALTPLTARLHDATSAALTWVAVNSTGYYDCTHESKPWLFLLASGTCMHHDANGTAVDASVQAVTGNVDRGVAGKPWRAPVSVMPTDASIVETHSLAVSRLHCVQLCNGTAYWMYKSATCTCLDDTFLQHDTDVPVGYIMAYNDNPDNATFAMSVGNKPYACPRNITHAPFNGFCVQGADIFTEWGGVQESTPLLRRFHVTEIITDYTESLIDITPQEDSTCSTLPYVITNVPTTSLVFPLGHQMASELATTKQRDTQVLLNETVNRAQVLLEVHVEPDFDECNEVAEAASVIVNLQAQQASGSAFCTEGTCSNVFVDMTQNIARAQNAYQLALSKCQLTTDLMGDTHFYVSVTQCAETEAPTEDGCVDLASLVVADTPAPTPAPTAITVSSLLNAVNQDTVFFGNCSCLSSVCNCTCDCGGQLSSITGTELPFNHTNGQVDCNEFCRLAPLPDVSTDFCTYSRERKLYHMHFRPEWTLTRPTPTTSDVDAMQWCQSNIACSLFTKENGQYAYYADPEFTLANCDQPRKDSLFTQASTFSLSVITYYKSSCCTGVVI